MHKKKSIYLTFLLTFKITHSAVSEPSTNNNNPNETNKWSVNLRSTLERGKVEPNEDKSSFQKAKINIFQTGIQRNLGDYSFGKNHYVRIDYRYFTSGEEKAAGQKFYNSDTGHVATISYGLSLIAESDKRLSLYISATPFADFNKEKFSNPRVDYFNFGVVNYQGFNELFFFENLIHYGSGIPQKQNSYLALTSSLGVNLESKIDWPLTLRFGPYAEMDLEDRKDEKYDAAFSAGGSDRIRSMKVGLSQSIDVGISQESSLQIGYIQKLGGYDAPATQAYFANLRYSF